MQSTRDRENILCPLNVDDHWSEETFAYCYPWNRQDHDHKWLSGSSSWKRDVPSTVLWRDATLSHTHMTYFTATTHMAHEPFLTLLHKPKYIEQREHSRERIPLPRQIWSRYRLCIQSPDLDDFQNLRGLPCTRIHVWQNLHNDPISFFEDMSQTAEKCPVLKIL